MTLWHAVMLGIIQGLTEFLPVSSSGHLVVVSSLLRWPDPSVNFAIALHLGTLLAVVVYFWQDWLDMARGKSKGILWSILGATFVTGIIAYLIGPYRDVLDHQPRLTAWLLIIFGLLLWVVDWRARQLPKRSLGTGSDDKAPSFIQSIYLGLAQVIALAPGVSRSGIVITAARTLRMNKEEAARFAFLLSAPTIALTPLALLFNRTGSSISADPLLYSVLGAVAAFGAGMLAISFLLQIVKRVSLGWFALYRVVLAVYILSAVT